MDELAAIADALSPDLICVVETWLCSDISNSEISLTGYQLRRLDRDRHGGGVLNYLRDVFLLPEPTHGLELLTLILQHNTLPTRICHPPNSGAKGLPSRRAATDPSQHTHRRTTPLQ